MSARWELQRTQCKKVATFFFKLEVSKETSLNRLEFFNIIISS